MRRILPCASGLILLALILPSFLFLFGVITLPACKWTMLLMTIAWFAVTPLWMGRE